MAYRAPLFEQEPLVYPVVASSTFRLRSAHEGFLLCEGKDGYLYSRWRNPTVAAAAGAVQQLEEAAGTLLFPSGMAAITTTLLTILKTGDHIVAPRVVYSGTSWSLNNTFARWGLEVSWVDGSNIEDYKKAIKPNTKVLYGETPANPVMGMLDLEAFGQLGASVPGVMTVVDSTFASPYLQKPIKHGIDIVVHCCTKYMGGHSDLTAGCVSFRAKEQFEQVYGEAKVLGTLALSPFDAFLLHRGLKTLHLRMEKHSSNALALAQFLESHPKVLRANYPGLPSHPGYETAKKQMKNFGGMLSFEVAGGLEAGRQLVEATKVIILAVSLGGTESLIEHPASMTHTTAFLTPEDQASANITSGLLRLSVGIEDVDELKADLQQALDKITVG